MESHHTSKRGAMAAAEDRLSGLPDDLLAKTFLTDLDTTHRIGAKFRSS